MEKRIEIKLTVDEVVEQLFEMDNKQVAELFKKWNRKFEDNFLDAMDKNPKGYYIHSLYHFMLYVIDDLDYDGQRFFSDVYSAMFYKFIDNKSKEHLLTLNI